MQAYKNYIGIDPGLTGAVGILRADGYGARAQRIPTYSIAQYFDGKPVTASLPDTPALTALLLDLAPCAVALEYLTPEGIKSRRSIMSLGSSVQACIDATLAAGAALVLVSPREWQKIIPKYYRNASGRPGKTSTRKGEDPPSVKFVSGRWHKKVLRRTVRCVTPDHNFADALCIALWGRRHFTGEADAITEALS